MKVLGLFFAGLWLTGCSTPIAHLSPMTDNQGVKTFRFTTNQDFINHYGDKDTALASGLPIYMGRSNHCSDGYQITEHVTTSSGHIFYGHCK